MANILSDSDWRAVLHNDAVPFHAQVVFFRMALLGPLRKEFFDWDQTTKGGCEWLHKHGAKFLKGHTKYDPWIDMFLASKGSQW